MARNWRDIRADAVAPGALDAERAGAVRKEMREVVQGAPPGRHPQGSRPLQANVAALMGISQARVWKLESGDLSHSELGMLQTDIAAPGSQLRIAAEFDHDAVELTA